MRPASVLYFCLRVVAALAVLPLLLACFTVFHGELLGFTGAWLLFLAGLGASILTLRVLWPYPRPSGSQEVEAEADLAWRVDAIVIPGLAVWAAVLLALRGPQDFETQAVSVVAICVAIMAVPLMLRSRLRGSSGERPR